MPGLRNVGLLFTQELEAGVPQRSDWPEAARRARRLLGLRDRPLAEGLGFGVSPLSTKHVDAHHRRAQPGHRRLLR